MRSVLQTQRHDDVGAGDGAVEVGLDRHRRQAVLELSRPGRRGSSVGGPQTTTSAPSFVRPQMSERATRLCMTSPTMTMRLPREVADGAAQRVEVEQALASGGRASRRRR